MYYVDDIYRSYSGNFAFLSASRYTSEYLSKLIHLNLYRNTDISPVTHLIAIASISIGSMILIKIIFKKQNFLGTFNFGYTRIKPIFSTKYEL
ncbi:glucosyltransferase domain-containing protein [Campylobacter hominis]